MKNLFKILILLATFSVSAQEKLTFDQSLTKAQNEHKNVFLFFSGSDWCAPCVKFKKFYVDTEQFKTFSDEKLVVYNADFPRQKKNQLAKEIAAENGKLADKYNSKGQFPMILLLNDKGEVIKKWEQLPSETLEQFIEKLKS
ncbi:thioredoxin family protein [Flavobacterium terrae]|uniref:Thioredoxin-like n=1 Tax=Flavobacterium terrae TaxID=415425 RepID=A0A1M6GHI2_9FLAO|nr:thioredoxin family protein [Flavobacterium terrae]SHJ09465.1 Thioredoxin-like [Flavobacterium terrae]